MTHPKLLIFPSGTIPVHLLTQTAVVSGRLSGLSTKLSEPPVPSDSLNQRAQGGPISPEAFSGLTLALNWNPMIQQAEWPQAAPSIESGAHTDSIKGFLKSSHRTNGPHYAGKFLTLEIKSIFHLRLKPRRQWLRPTVEWPVLTF